MKKLLIATGNQGKFDGIKSYLKDLPFQLLSLQDVNISIPDEVEDGVTYEENAMKKASYCAQKTGLLTLADDSGLIVNALQGELGVFTRRWGAGPNVTDEEWLDFFMKRMENEKNRRGKFVSCICVVNGFGESVVASRGENEGIILEKIAAPIKLGVPLSSVFLSDGAIKVNSALSIEEKNKVSHRGKALKVIREYFENNI